LELCLVALDAGVERAKVAGRAVGIVDDRLVEALKLPGKLWKRGKVQTHYSQRPTG
jgi:hypothetical protein